MQELNGMIFMKTEPSSVKCQGSRRRSGHYAEAKIGTRTRKQKGVAAREEHQKASRVELGSEKARQKIQR